MSLGAISSVPWAPLPDDQLTWFRADQKLFSQPRPLYYTLEIHALVFGLTYALESIEFPLYALRSRLVNRWVYLAAVPSAVAENNFTQRLKNIHTQSVRFTRDIQRAWERQIKPEVESYNRRFEAIANFAGSSSEFAELVRQLRRERGNQWFAAIRGVVAPTALLQQNVEDFGAEIVATARALTKEALSSVAERGRALVALALTNAGQRLVLENVIDCPEDVFWVVWMDVRELLRSAVDRRALIAQRKSAVGNDFAATMPDTLGPDLPANAPRMYLIPEVLRLLDQ